MQMATTYNCDCRKKKKITLSQTQNIALIREAAQRNLLFFAQRIMPLYQIGKHHRIMAEYLEALERGEIKKLMIAMPPQHGKSTLITQIFPCWYMGRNPQSKNVQCGYSEEIALRHSRIARDFFCSQEMNNCFPNVHHNPQRKEQRPIIIQRQAAHEWGTTDGGDYYAVGIGGGLTGRPITGIGIIDDPIKDRQEADSKLIRNRIYDWYRAVFCTRLAPEAKQILIQTRWHEDDLAGRLLAEEGNKWTQLILPAIDTNGVGLWEEKYPREWYADVKTSIGKREWEALYLQSPRPQEGKVLDSSLLKMIDADKVPQMVRIVRRWDLAFSEKQGADYTTGAKIGIDERGNRYILHIKRLKGRWTSSKPIIIETAISDGVNVPCYIEANGTQLGYYDDIKGDPRMQGRKVEPDRPEGSKESRASAYWGSRLQDGIIFCLRGEWNEVLFDEMDSFPNGAHDDQVDAISGAMFMVTENKPITIGLMPAWA